MQNILKEALEPLQNFPTESNQTSVQALLMVGFLLLVKEDYAWVSGQNDKSLVLAECLDNTLSNF